jgi:hypothetical protein
MYLSVRGEDYTNIYVERIKNAEIQNPIEKFQLIFDDDSEEIDLEGAQVIKIDTAEGEKRIIIKNIELGDLTLEEIEAELVNYASVALKLYNLHNTPFTYNTPKIQFYIDDSAYSAEVIQGDIFVEPGIIENPDIIIRTTYEAIFNAVENEAEEGSFGFEDSSIELVSSKFILFTKGYLGLYKEFEGQI